MYLYTDIYIYMYIHIYVLIYLTILMYICEWYIARARTLERETFLGIYIHIHIYINTRDKQANWKKVLTLVRFQN